MGKNLVTPYPVRMPDDLRQHLEQAARQNGRSLNAEILLRLQASVDASDQAEAEQADADLVGRVATLEQRLAVLEQAIEDLRDAQRRR